jgi:hypothetical protein
MGIRTVTVIFLYVFVLGAIIYDFYAYSQGGTEATISWIVAEWAYTMPAGVFAVGFIAGHLFWQMNPKKKGLIKDD